MFLFSLDERAQWPGFMKESRSETLTPSAGDILAAGSQERI